MWRGTRAFLLNSFNSFISSLMPYIVLFNHVFYHSVKWIHFRLKKALETKLSLLFVVMTKGERLWIYDARLHEILRPLLWQNASPGAFLRQPWPANGDEAVAEAAPSRTDKALYANMTLMSQIGLYDIWSLAAFQVSYAVDKNAKMFSVGLSHLSKRVKVKAGLVFYVFITF